MIREVDDFIVDRIFQPLVDRVDHAVSPYVIARTLAEGSLLLQSLAQWKLDSWFGVGLCIPVWSYIVVHAHLLTKLPPSNVLPAERVTGIYLRAILVSVDLVDTISRPVPDFWNGTRMFSCWVVVVALYLLACRRRPPRREVVLFGKEAIA